MIVSSACSSGMRQTWSDNYTHMDLANTSSRSFDAMKGLSEALTITLDAMLSA
jgi:hypothetical protein